MREKVEVLAADARHPHPVAVDGQVQDAANASAAWSAHATDSVIRHCHPQTRYLLFRDQLATEGTDGSTQRSAVLKLEPWSATVGCRFSGPAFDSLKLEVDPKRSTDEGLCEPSENKKDRDVEDGEAEQDRCRLG